MIGYGSALLYVTGYGLLYVAPVGTPAILVYFSGAVIGQASIWATIMTLNVTSQNFGVKQRGLARSFSLTV